MNSAYIASILNSTLRSTTPILLAALGSAVCSRVGVFNIALGGQMPRGACCCPWRRASSPGPWWASSWRCSR